MLECSVVVCTANRPLLLAKCLQSLASQTIDADKYEIIVVDNCIGGDDETKSVTRRMAAPIRMRYAVEGGVGLSNARNRGISMAEGDVVAFIDDDAVADARWLEETISVYRSYGDVAAVGGRVKLVWETDIPSWLHPELYAALSELDYGREVTEIAETQYLNGCNFSIKRSVIAKVGAFSTRLGRRGDSLLGGEETEMLMRIRAQGGRCYYAPRASVYHLVPKSRMNKGFFRRRVYWGARSAARMGLMHAPQSTWKIMMARLIRVPYQWAQSIWLEIRRQPAPAFLWRTYCWSAYGYFVEVVGSLLSKSTWESWALGPARRATRRWRGLGR